MSTDDGREYWRASDDEEYGAHARGRFLIWSLKHGAWWGADRCGYFSDSALAGRYEAPDAGDIVIGSGLPNENVAVADIPGAIKYWLERVPR